MAMSVHIEVMCGHECSHIGNVLPWCVHIEVMCGHEVFT